MASPRNFKSSLSITKYFHCTSRCVRGAYLCGVDKTSGQDFSHRKVWLKNRLHFLTDVFSIKLAAYAIMDNHFHVLLKVEDNAQTRLSDQAVIEKWHSLFKGNSVSHKFMNNEALSPKETETLQHYTKKWRAALSDISWFMRCLKEPLARMCNKEDGCKGHFWQGRFHSQLIIGIRALVACMAYIDLNPLRAKLVKTPEQSQYTTLNTRLNLLINEGKDESEKFKTSLVPFLSETSSRTETIPISFDEYLILLDKQSRTKNASKRGALETDETHILNRLGILKINWHRLDTFFQEKFSRFVVDFSDVNGTAALKKERKFFRGKKACLEFFDRCPTHLI